MSTEHRIDQLDKIIAISAARKLRKQDALQAARQDLYSAEIERDEAKRLKAQAQESLQQARLDFAQQAASDQALLWRSHCETKRDQADAAHEETLLVVEDRKAAVQIAVDDLLRHNFRHDRIIDHAAQAKRQRRNTKEARSDDEFTDSRSGISSSSFGGDA
jgi:hypothetical protein